MNNRTLGTLGMVGAPFLFIDFVFHGSNGGGENYPHTSLSGIFSLIYITAWLFSIMALWKMKAAGEGKFGKTMLIIPIITLMLANAWNVYEIVAPAANTTLYFILDAFWPISNLIMFFVGIAVLTAKRLPGWKRYVPIMVGLWLPLSIVLSMIVGQSVAMLMFSGIYSTITWFLLGYITYTSAEVYQPSLQLQTQIK